MARLISDKFKQWASECDDRFNTLKANEEELNRIFIEIYGLQDELTTEVEDKDVTVRRADLGREIRSLISYAIGCMFGRYSLDTDGLAYAGGDWDSGKYRSLIPDKDNVIPITDEEYFADDIVGRFVEFIRAAYGDGTLEGNLQFIASALGGRGDTTREIIRGYFIRDFYKDHLKIYQKRPIYWLFDSGKENGFKALIYLHRYNEDTIGKLRVDYLHRMQRVYENEIKRMRETIENSANARDVSNAQKRLEKLTKQHKEAREYDEKIAHLALARISLDLDDGVKVNYEKLQTGVDGKKYEVLGKI
jgi:type II restriction/modification system DNA methylase subunit YeeA